MSKELKNEGHWRAVFDFMKAENPFLGIPPVTRNPDGSLNVRTETGPKLCKVGDYLVSKGNCKYDVRYEAIA